jgi:hypothetical protein
MRLICVIAAALVGAIVFAGAAAADNGNAPTTMSFFSSGGGAHADWLATADQPTGDTDRQAVRLLTTTQGYAGILFHHVTGIPAEAYPDSSFWVKSTNYAGPSLGSPRLVVLFQDALGQPVGYGDLRPLVLGPTWQLVAGNNWDVMGGPCGFRYQVAWEVVQSCFATFTTLAVYMTTDPYGVEHRIDDIETNHKTFSSASDNGNGNNSAAGPDATTDPTLLPPLIVPSTVSG